jgi:hypothetical protein
MKRRKLNGNGWLCLIVLGLLIAGGIGRTQLQQSGGPGSAVTVTSGSITANAGTNLNTSNLDVALSTRLKPADTLAAVTTVGTVTTVGAVTAITNALPAGTNVIGHIIADSGTLNVIPKTACGNALATGSALAAIPTSSTLLTSAATACVISVFFSNTNSSSGTVTLTDNTATPINAALTFSIPSNSNLILPLEGVAFNLGVKWSASGTGFTGAVVAYQ